LLAAWPRTVTLEIDGVGAVLFCHATPRSETEVFTRVTPESTILPAFTGASASLVVCGHTHMQFDRMVGSVRVMNAGSVGMPFQQPPGAYWLLLGPGVEPRCTCYDFDQAARDMRATTFPQIEGLAIRYVLHPPTEAETLALFT
jgi:predicted phosphodiesterase